MVLLEVEQKFSFYLNRVPQFKANQGSPPFRSLQRRRPHAFEDVYYDSADVLSTKGIYLRRRNGVWQAKKRVSGDYNRSTFEEFTDIWEIYRLVKRHFPKAPDAKRNFGLERLCQFVTTRQNFIADDLFRIVLDETNFGHSVGEVEILTEKDGDEAHGKIDAFMTRYSWFFNKDKPKGKLTAYFDKFRSG